MTPEEVAVDMDLPLQVVREAIAYCEANPEIIQRDHDEEEALTAARPLIEAEIRLHAANSQ